MKKIKLDHVERLSRGKRSGLHIGSRSVGHHLHPHERATYQRALKKGYLEVTSKDRSNLWHIWEKACLAMECDFLVLIKQVENGVATIYLNNELHSEALLQETKTTIQELASA